MPKFIKPNDKYPQDALHTFPENAPENFQKIFNTTMLNLTTISYTN